MNRSAKKNASCPSLPSKRVKKESPSAEDIADKDVEDLLIIAEGAQQGYDATKKEPGIEVSDVEAAMKSEDDNIVDSPALVLRLRTTVTAKFKTSSGRVRIAEDQPALMTYGDFRKLFGIPLETPKKIEFMKWDDQRIVAVDDNMKLSLIDGCIIAETCTDF